jgi:hypothetical protein
MLIPAVVAKFAVSSHKVRAYWLDRTTISTDETVSEAGLTIVDESKDS